MSQPPPPALLARARSLPDAPGVYIMKDNGGREIYVGKAKSLRRRVSSYFQAKERQPKETALIENIADFDYVETGSEIEALLLEGRLIKDLHPKYNALLKNNEPYPLIEVTWGEDFPRVLVARRKRDQQSRYFGPFVGAAELRTALAVLQRIFRFRTCTRKLQAGDRRRRHQRGCLNYHIGRCAGACCDRIDREAYRKQIAGLCRFLAGQKQELIEELRRDMDQAATRMQFESAAALRDTIHALETIHSQPVQDDSLAPFSFALDPEQGLDALAKALGTQNRPRRIEGIDIATLQGQETVGALVSFLDGVPWKDGYRRFRIKTVAGQDDYAAIAEIVRRRYGRLQREDEALPDLVLIDGGKGQLQAAQRALAEIGVEIPALLSLAKEEETPYAAGRPDPLPLSRRNAGLKLLMYVRDEAHRFAQHYHHILRRKAMFGE